MQPYCPEPTKLNNYVHKKERTLKSKCNLKEQNFSITYIEKDCYQLGGVVMRISFRGESDRKNCSFHGNVTRIVSRIQHEEIRASG